MTQFKKVLELFIENRIDFILIGGVAAVAHGSAIATNDIDFVYSRKPENLKNIVKTLLPYKPYLRGAPPELPFVFDFETLKSGLNFTLDTTLGSIDLLGEVTGGGSYDQLLSHSIELSAFGFKCKCLDLPTLIHTKRAAGRSKDLQAIAELELIAERKRS